MAIIRVRERGQVTLPKELRETIGAEEDTPLLAEAIGRAIVLSSVKKSALSTLQRRIKTTVREKGINLSQILKEIKAERKAFNKKYYGI